MRLYINSGCHCNNCSSSCYSYNKRERNYNIYYINYNG